MNHQTIILTLTNEQLTHLNNAMLEHQNMNIDAIGSKSFQDDRSDLFKQCDAIQVFLDSVKNTLDESYNA